MQLISHGHWWRDGGDRVILREMTVGMVLAVAATTVRSVGGRRKLTTG